MTTLSEMSEGVMLFNVVERKKKMSHNHSHITVKATVKIKNANCNHIYNNIDRSNNKCKGEELPKMNNNNAETDRHKTVNIDNTNSETNIKSNPNSDNINAETNKFRIANSDNINSEADKSNTINANNKEAEICNSVDTDDKRKDEAEKENFSKKLSSIIPIWTFIYGIANILANLLYQQRASEHYGIPAFYFSYNINKLIIICSAFIIVCVLTIFAFNSKRTLLKPRGKFEFADIIVIILQFIATAICTILLTFVSLCNTILKSNYKRDSSFFANADSSQVLIALYIIIISTFVFVICAVYLSVNGNTDIKILKLNLKFKKFASAVVTIFIVICLIFNIFSTIYLFKFPTDNERNMEFIETTENTEYVVITHYNNTLLAVPYSFENGNYTFYTKKYYFIDPNECTYNYKFLDYEPKIEKNLEYKSDSYAKFAFYQFCHNLPSTLDFFVELLYN